MSGDGNFKWYWGHGAEPEVYYGQEDSRDAILQVARQETDGEDGFSIVEADKSVASPDVFDAEYVLEWYEERNEECWGEDGAEIHPTPAARRELEVALADVLKTWLAKNELGKAWSFGTTRNSEYFPPVERSAPTPAVQIKEE